MQDTVCFSVSNSVSLSTLCVFRQLGMLAESMSVGFPLRQMNRFISTFFLYFFPMKYVPANDTNIDLLSCVAVCGYIF